MNINYNGNNDATLNYDISEEEIKRFLTDENNGIKMIKLCIFHELVLEKSLSEIPFQKFYECYEKLNETNLNTKSILSYLYTNVFQTLSDKIKSDFQSICQERQVSNRLSELEQILLEQPNLQNSKRCPPSSVVDPEEQIKSKITDIKLLEKDRLLAIYQNLLKENTKLKKQTTDLEKQKAIALEKVKTKVDDISTLVGLSASLDN